MQSAYEPTYRHPGLGFEVEPAGGWSLLEEDDRTAVMAVAPEEASRPAIVTVAAQPIDPGWDAATFAEEALAAQAATPGRLRVIDRAGETIGGLPAVRVVLQRPGDDGEVVVLDEWRVAQDVRGWTVSAYCPIAAYAALAPAVRATAQSLRLPPPGDLPAPRVTFDPVEGVLSLTADDLTALTEHYEGGAGDPAGLAALEAAGVLAGGVVDPLVADMLAAVRAAGLKITVQGRAADAMAWSLPRPCERRRSADRLAHRREHLRERLAPRVEQRVQLVLGFDVALERVEHVGRRHRRHVVAAHRQLARGSHLRRGVLQAGSRAAQAAGDALVDIVLPCGRRVVAVEGAQVDLEVAGEAGRHARERAGDDRVVRHALATRLLLAHVGLLSPRGSARRPLA